MPDSVELREPRDLSDADLEEIVARMHDLEDGDDATHVTASQVRDLVHNVREARATAVGLPDDIGIVTLYSTAALHSHGDLTKFPKSDDPDAKHSLVKALDKTGKQRVLYRGSEYDQVRYEELMHKACL